MEGLTWCFPKSTLIIFILLSIAYFQFWMSIKKLFAYKIMKNLKLCKRYKKIKIFLLFVFSLKIFQLFKIIFLLLLSEIISNLIRWDKKMKNKIKKREIKLRRRWWRKIYIKIPLKTFTAHALPCLMEKARIMLNFYCLLPCSSIALKLEFYHKRIEEEVKMEMEAVGELREIKGTSINIRSDPRRHRESN